MHQATNHVRYLAIAALFAAMTTVSIVLFRIPVGQGIIHVGDTVIYLAATLLPKPYALAAAAIGGGMANIITPTTIWLPATVIIKPLIAASFTANGNFISRRNVFALFLAAIITVVGYYLWAAIVVYGSWISPLASSVWGGLTQSGGSAVIFLLVGGTFDRVNLKKRLGMGKN